MTCIIGLEHNGVVYIGGDSQASNGVRKGASRVRKVFHTGNFLIGATSSYRMINILRYNLAVRDQNANESDEEYMVTAFVEASRTAFKSGGYTYIDNSREWGGDFLVGYKRTLYVIQTDFQLNHYDEGLYCAGSGYEVAWGAMLALEDMPPKKRIKTSLEIAGKVAVGVGAPYYVESLRA